jgi:hypothetical protein
MQSYTLNGNWYKVNPVSDMVLPPKIVLKPGTSAEDVILYRVFRDGRPLKNKLLEYENLLDQTSKYIEILSAKAAQPDLWIGPKSLISDIKKAVINARFSSEPYMVANSQVLAENPIQTVQTPDPSKQLEALWTRYDYIVQEICAVLGLPYNPNQNKKERLNKHEVISEHSRIMPVINSMESMLKPSAKEMGETVEHISSKLIRDSGIERV